MINCCVCCGGVNVALIYLRNCSHKAFLECYFKSKINFTITLVCNYCHAILEKIDDFKKQVECQLTNPQLRPNSKPNFTMVTVALNQKPVKRNTTYPPWVPPTHVKQETSVKDESLDVKMELDGTYNRSQYKVDGLSGDPGEYNINKQLKTVAKPERMVKEEPIVLKTEFVDTDNRYQDEVEGLAVDPLAEHSITDERPNSTPNLTTVAKPVTPTMKPNAEENTYTARVQSTTHTQPEITVKIERLGENIECDDVGDTYLKGIRPTLTVDSVRQHSINKVKKKREKNNSVGNVFAVALSEEEMQKEREKQREDDKYQKRPFKCEKCIVAFDHEINLTNHNEHKHKQTDNGYECEICHCVFRVRILLQKHRKKHFIRFECQKCKKRYLERRSAELHYNKIHADGTQFRCKAKDCAFQTCSKRSLKNHHNHHVRGKCGHCGKLYMKKTQLNTHAKYICDDCDIGFANKDKLRRHIERTHMNTPTYKCKLCPEVLWTSRSLGRHVKVKHKSSG